MSPAPLPDKARETALGVLTKAEDGVHADARIEQARRQFDSRDNAFILELIYGVLRNRTYLDRMLNRFSAKPLDATDAWTRNILRMAVYQMLFLNRVPVSAAVNTAVQLAKKHGGKHGYVNGLLRSVDRNRESLGSLSFNDAIERLSVLYSHPAWLVRRWNARFGPEQTEALLKANNQPSPLTLRTNTFKTTRAELRSSLESEGCETEETFFSPAGIHLLSVPGGIRNLAAYRQGWFLVQDEAAQLVGIIADPRPGDTVLEACAAPGGKATHMAELMRDQGMITALEIDNARIMRIQENMRRLGLAAITPLQGDASGFRNGLYDRVLIDAPCSGLGVLRRHPDGRWNKNEASIRDHAGLQKRILSNCAGLVKPGGVLAYSTCTTEPEENEDVISWFLEREGRAFSLDDPRQALPEAARGLVESSLFFRTFPNEPGMDGFFCVRLKKLP